ncbi:MAG TPA: hypothetical protein PKM25_03940, partial [Candidatus Ozemobacteraceae bacterium]|nr:hypothetical protein [Candidatus Ozemobacteraceae bacterium]
MRAKYILSAIAAIFIIACACQAMIATLKLPDLVRKAEIIAIATVVTTKEVATDKDQITTVRNELKPDKILKGIWKPAEPFVVMTRQSGNPGQIGWIDDQPQFPPKGQTCVVFLKRTDGDTLEIINLVQGVWPMVNGKPAGMGLGMQLA